MIDVSRSLGRVGILVLLLSLGACGFFESAASRVEKAEKYRSEGNYRTALIELRNALEDEPQNARARVLLADTALRLGDAEAALNAVRAAVKAGADPAEAAPIIARSMLILSRQKELLAEIEGGTLKLPTAELEVARANALLGLGRFEDAEAAFRKALEADGASVQALTGLAQVRAAEGDLQNALAQLDKVTQQKPDAPLPLLHRGLVLLSMGRYEDADASLVRALEVDRNELLINEKAAAASGRTEVQLAAGKVDVATERLTELQGLAPTAFGTKLLEARVALAKQDYRAAASTLQMMAQAVPDSVPVRFLLGSVMLAQGNLEQAEFHLSKVVALAPENLEARKRLAQARLRQSRPQAAIDTLAPALNGDIVDPQVDALLAAASEQSGDFASAVDLFEKRASATPGDSDAKISLAAASLSAGEPSRALEALKSVPAQARDARYAQLLIAATAAGHTPAEAIRRVDLVVKEDPRNSALLITAAAFNRSNRNNDAARRLLEQAKALDPKGLPAIVAMAGLDSSEGKLAAARASLSEASNAHPDSVLVKVALADLAWRQGQKAEARRILEQLRDARPDATSPPLMLARLYLTDGETERGQKMLSEVVAASRNDPGVLSAAGKALMDSGRYEAALSYFRQAADREPGMPAYWLEAARAQIALSQWAGARASLQKALDIYPGSVVAATLAALVDMREGKNQDALARAVDVRKRNPRSGPAAMLEGDVRSKLGQHAEAAEAYRESMKLAPTPDVHLRLAESYRLAGRRADAVAQYEALIARGAGNALVLNNLAWLYHETGDARAEALARRAVEAAPGNPQIADTLGWLLLSRGKAQESSEILKKAVASAPADANLRYHYAAALARNGEREEARRQIEQSLAHAPGPDERQAAQRLRDELIR